MADGEHAIIRRRDDESAGAAASGRTLHSRPPAARSTRDHPFEHRGYACVLIAALVIATIVLRG